MISNIMIVPFFLNKTILFLCYCMTVWSLSFIFVLPPIKPQSIRCYINKKYSTEINSKPGKPRMAINNTVTGLMGK